MNIPNIIEVIFGWRIRQSIGWLLLGFGLGFLLGGLVWGLFIK